MYIHSTGRLTTGDCTTGMLMWLVAFACIVRDGCMVNRWSSQPQHSIADSWKGNCRLLTSNVLRYWRIQLDEKERAL